MGDGGFTPPPAAFDVPPDTPFQAGEIAAGAAEIAGGILADKFVTEIVQVFKVGGELALLIFLIKHVKDILALWNTYVAPLLKDVGKSVVEGATQLIEPVADLFGTLSEAYVSEITRHYALEHGGGTASKGTPAGNAAKYAFDSIVAPIAFFTSGSSPDQNGAGARNIQQTLGVIVQLHLITWVVNVISNVTGLGTLKFMNSFTEVILDALNARSFSRVAMRPYLNTFVAEPATKELNTQWPLKTPSPSNDVKEFIRGQISVGELQARNKGLGFDENKTAQLVLDTAKLFSPVEAAFYVRMGVWTADQAEQSLVVAGYEKDAAHAALLHEIQALSFELLKRYADEQGIRVAARALSGDDYVTLLQDVGFTQIEAGSYRAVYETKIKDYKRLSYTQVKALYTAGLVPLQFVTDWLAADGYSPDDASLLTLLDFTSAEEVKLRKAVLAAQARVLAIERAQQATADAGKGAAALSAALDALAKAKAALASNFGA